MTQVYPDQVAGKATDLTAITAMQQCMAEQQYVRDSVTRSLIYNQARARAPPGIQRYGCLSRQRSMPSPAWPWQLHSCMPIGLRGHWRALLAMDGVLQPVQCPSP